MEVKKSYFYSIGNDSKVDGLVNFEKLRMIAKEIRQVVRMTSANMDPAMMFRQRYVIEVCKCYRVALSMIYFSFIDHLPFVT